MIALVPMKHTSERVPQKNYRDLNGKPVFHYILETLCHCDMIFEVVVDTDSDVIKAGIAEYFPYVRVIDRPKHLQGATVSMNAIIDYDTSQIDAHFFLQTHCTNPLLTRETIEAAINKFDTGWPNNDSLFSVTQVHKRFWYTGKFPVNHNPSVLLRTQDLPPIYEENSCIYIFSKKIFNQRNNNRLGFNPIMFEVDVREAWDIDTSLDFKIVEMLCREGNNEGINFSAAPTARCGPIPPPVW